MKDLYTPEEKFLETSGSLPNSGSMRLKDMDKLFSLLRKDLYKHNIRTPVQEYISNAVDANIEAGTQDQ